MDEQESRVPLGALPVRIVAFAAGWMLALAAGFGLTRLADPPRSDPPRSAPLSAVIPRPPGPAAGDACASRHDSYHARGEVNDTAVGATGLGCPAAARTPWRQPRLAEPAK